MRGDNCHSRNGQIIEFTDSMPMCYHLRLKAISDSVPSSATNKIKTCSDAGLFYFRLNFISVTILSPHFFKLLLDNPNMLNCA